MIVLILEEAPLAVIRSDSGMSDLNSPVRNMLLDKIGIKVGLVVFTTILTLG